ncbi:MAG: orotidine-5'-phosphate decarboxylase [Gemmatimonadetes bacterium]|nr:orotidine-5'-phosphate decarboxylase [Gemmatimonadota bacterium]
MAELKAVPIVALDYGTAADALALVRALGDSCGFYKVGSELFTAAGPAVIRAIREMGHEVFLDLKFHDIPNTVAGAVRSAVETGASMLTVHASGGSAMLKAAVDAAGSCRVMGVTVLTSFTAAGLGEAWGREVPDVGREVARLAGLCEAAGAHGLVCSGHELAGVRSAAPGLRPLVPGIRFADGATHDQARVMTPEAAAGAGAAYLVIGRMVTGAPDPVAAMRRVNAALG